MVDQQYREPVQSVFESVAAVESFISKGEIEIPEGERVAQALGRQLSQLLSPNVCGFYNNASVQQALYPVAFRCLAFLEIFDETTYFKECLSMIMQFAWIKKAFSVEEIDQIIFAFEKAVSLHIKEAGEKLEKEKSPNTKPQVTFSTKQRGTELLGVLFSFLRIFDILYEGYFNEISGSLDSILVASVDTSSITVMDRYGTHNNTGIKLLTKMSRKDPKKLYPFVQDLFRFYSNPVLRDEILSTFSYIAAKNALIFKDKVDPVYTTARSVNQSRVYQITTTILSRVGRVDPATARKCQLCLLQFLKDEVDVNLNYPFLGGIFNIAGVYKQSLEEEDLEFLREFARQQSDLFLSEVIQKILDYYANRDLKYMKDAFLQDQRDVLGRLIYLVDEKIDAKLSNIESSIVQLQERTEKIEDVLYIHQEDLDRVKGQVTQLGDRMNVVEVAKVLMEEQMREMNENLEDLASKVMSQQSGMKEFMALVVKKLPIPSSYVAKGKIRKRLILTFKCSKGRKPDFVMKTADWSKWITVVFLAAQTVEDAGRVSVLGLLKDLKALYDALTKSGLNGETRFGTLISAPFLTSKEEDDLIRGLRSNGFFDQFDYDTATATWYRKVGEPAAAAKVSGLKEETKGSTQIEKSAVGCKDVESKNASLVEIDVKEDFSDLNYGCFLYKTGGLFGSQRKRWFQISGGKELDSVVITYSVDQQGTQVKGKIQVSDLLSVSSLELLDSGLWFNWFSKTHNGSYRLRCEKKEEYEAWVRILRRCSVPYTSG